MLGTARRTRGRSRTSRPPGPRGPAFESTPLSDGKSASTLADLLPESSTESRIPITASTARSIPDLAAAPLRAGFPPRPGARDRTEPGSRTGLRRPPLRLAPRIPSPLPPAGPLARSSALPAKRMVRSSARRPKPRRLAKQPLHRWRAGDYCGDHPAATPGPTCRRRMHMTVALADAPNADGVILVIAREVARRGV